MSNSFAISWTVAFQAPLTMGFPRQENEWVAISFFRGSFQPRDQTCISCVDRQILYHWVTREVQEVSWWWWWWFSHFNHVQSWAPMDYSPAGSSVHGISQARILEWIAISFFRGSSWPRDWTHISCIADRLFTAESPGRPK